MATLTIENLDSDVHEMLRREATQDRQRRARMRAHSNELERFVKKLPQSSNAVDLLRNDRESR
jgi:hypothetical protein